MLAEVPKIGQAKDLEDAADLLQILVDDIRAGKIRGFVAATADLSDDEYGFRYWFDGALTRPEKLYMVEKMRQVILGNPPGKDPSCGEI